MRMRSNARSLAVLAAVVPVLVLGCSPSASAVGTEVIGSMQARIDGEPGTWETLSLPAEGTATASYSRFGAGATIAIQGHDPGAESRMRNVLSLQVTVMGEGASAQLIGDVILGLYPDGMAGASWQASAADITWERLELGADGGHATGRFTASLCRQEGAFSEPDPDDCRAIEGEFDTALQAD